MKKSGLAIMGLAAVLGIGSAAGVCAGTKKIIKYEDGKRVEIDVEQNAPAAIEPTATEPADLSFGGFEEDLDSAFSYDGNVAGDVTQDIDQGEVKNRLEPVRIRGNVLEKLEGGFSIDSKAQEGEGYQGEMVIHVDPENTLILDSMTGLPAKEDAVAPGQTLYVYISPVMTMSLPPQTTAELVLANIPQDAGVPLYVTASKALEGDETGSYVLKTIDGKEIKVPADCPITPYLTRQMVRLEDISEGRKCLVWLGINGQAEKIMLFNE